MADNHDVSHEQKELVPLNGITIGIWRAQKNRTIHLLVQQKQEKFVFVVQKALLRAISAQFNKNLSRAVRSVLDVRSPFQASCHDAGGSVVTFEVCWQQIKGINYSSPLLEQSILVLEAREVVKREFAALVSALEWHCGCLPSAELEQKWSHAPGAAIVSALSLSRTQSLPDLDLPEDIPIQSDCEERSPSESSKHSEENDTARNGLEASPVAPCGNGLGPGELRRRFSDRVTMVRNKTIACSFTDPRAQALLKPCFQSNLQMLKHLESGIPSWAIFMGTYGLWYRPWMRMVTKTIFLAFTAFSFACGFYDLYKHVPFLNNAVKTLFDSVNLPGLDLMGLWEKHASIRLSILLTYLFGNSPVFLQVLKTLHNGWKALQELLTYGSRIMRGFLSPLDGVVSAIIAFSVWLLVGIQGLAQIFVQPLMAFSSSLLATATIMTRPIVQLGMLLMEALKQCSGPALRVRDAVMDWIPAVTSISSTSEVANKSKDFFVVTRWFYGVPADAGKVLRTSSIKVVKGSQAILRCIAYIGTSANKHRISLGIIVRMHWRKLIAFGEEMHARMVMACEGDQKRQLFNQSEDEEHEKDE